MDLTTGPSVELCCREDATALTAELLLRVLPTTARCEYLISHLRLTLTRPQSHSTCVAPPSGKAGTRLKSAAAPPTPEL